jgi:hypothetical protein
MLRFISMVAAAAILVSCGQGKPTIDYNRGSVDTTSVLDESIKDTTKILVSELPITFDSTDILLFGIRLVDLQERGGYSKMGSSSSGSSDYGSSHLNGDNLRGSFVNIVFHDRTGDSERKLTDKKMEIREVNFLRGIFRKTKTGYLLYSISDRDSNGDKELNDGDLEALYISKVDGSDFKKLTKELHELYDWRLIAGDSRIYFRTLEDKNKDGELNNKDKFHYYYIDFSGDKYAISEYNPMQVFE